MFGAASASVERMNGEIESRCLEGVRDALVSVGSPLGKLIEEILSGKPSTLPEGTRGTSPYPRYTIRVSDSEAEEIGKELAGIADARGYDAVFAGRQVNLLQSEWRRATSA